MKAITIWQPWASLIALGAKQIYVKRFETRSWKTDYRGLIAIHAAAVRPKTVIRETFPMSPWDNREKGIFLKSAWQALFPDKTAPKEDYEYLDGIETLPLGCIIATAELVNCWHILYSPKLDKSTNGSQIIIAAERQYPDCGKYFIPTEHEMLFGDWTPGRYAWELANVKMLPEPVPAKGRQRLWEWEG